MRLADGKPDPKLRAYLERICYDGDLQPTFAVVEQIVAAHADHIPFSGLDAFMGIPVSLDPNAIHYKLVGSGRGGYCQEQGELIFSVLHALGLKPQALSARVDWMRPSGHAPATHRVSLITLGGEDYLVDVGFGPNTPTIPLRMEPDMPQASRQARYRIRRAAAQYSLEVETLERWEPLYSFGTEPTDSATFEMANWFTSTHPRTLFVRNLIVARSEGVRSLGLINRTFTKKAFGEHASAVTLANAEELDDVLRGRLRLALPMPASSIWEKLPAETYPAWP